MRLIDIHAHLDNTKYEDDLDEVIERCREYNVTAVISGVNKKTNRKVLELQEKYPDVIKVTFGIYPLDALAKELESGEATGFSRDTEPVDIDKELAWIENNKNRCVAIGEIGLDYNWPEFQSDEIKQEQKDNFKKILKVARELDLPVIIHTRKAELDCVEILEKLNMKKVILHCFMGRKHLIKRAASNKWYFSIPPIITRLQHFQTLVELVPLEQLLTETDSPYLSPVAGERNEPANIRVTIKEIAKIKNLTEEEVAEQIWKNAASLFNLS
ncbi:MAG: TatD family hydrolase [Nanoarchaeota archaeon]|nr:TatD family hydrolase [Nanoarchaeota archaeon]